MSKITDWAEDHGYERFRDPRTGRTFYTDGDPSLDCPSGPYHNDKDDDEEETGNES